MFKWMQCLLLGLLVIAQPSQGAGQDPLESVMWSVMEQRFLEGKPYRFDSSIKIAVPPFAENPSQVPVSVDATGVSDPIEKIVVWADLNPIPHVYSFYPLSDQVEAKFSIRIKVQQATPVRAAVLTTSGEWLIGSQWLDAAGGGCTTPSLANAEPFWESHLGEVSSRRIEFSEGARFKFKVIHPMDTGLADGVPEFYLEQAELRNAEGKVLARLELSQPVSENPVMTFDMKGGDTKGYIIWMRDNGGNIFSHPL